MGSRRDCTWILGLAGNRVVTTACDAEAPDRTRPRKQPRHIGLDEIQRGKGQRFWTVLSDVVHGEVIGLRQDRTEAAATAPLIEDLTARQRAAITAVCTDMHRPYLNAVHDVLPNAEIAFDKFHVFQHASARSMTSVDGNSFALGL